MKRKRKKKDPNALQSVKDIRRWLENGGIMRFNTATITGGIGADVRWDDEHMAALLEVRQQHFDGKRDNIVASCHVKLPTTKQYMEHVAEVIVKRLREEASD